MFIKKSKLISFPWFFAICFALWKLYSDDAQKIHLQTTLSTEKNFITKNFTQIN